MTRPKRLSVSLTIEQHDALTAAARLHDEPTSRAAARLITTALTAPATAPPPPVQPVPPRWLQIDARPDWRTSAWHAGEALRARYPALLDDLPPDWALHASQRDPLLALAAWREDLDTGRQPDPRHELTFHAALRNHAHWLKDSHRDHLRQRSQNRYSGQHRPRPDDW